MKLSKKTNFVGLFGFALLLSSGLAGAHTSACVQIINRTPLPVFFVKYAENNMDTSNDLSDLFTPAPNGAGPANPNYVLTPGASTTTEYAASVGGSNSFIGMAFYTFDTGTGTNPYNLGQYDLRFREGNVYVANARGTFVQPVSAQSTTSSCKGNPTGKSNPIYTVITLNYMR